MELCGWNETINAAFSQVTKYTAIFPQKKAYSNLEKNH